MAQCPAARLSLRRMKLVASCWLVEAACKQLRAPREQKSSRALRDRFHRRETAELESCTRQSAADGTVPCCSRVSQAHEVGLKLLAVAGVSILQATASTSGSSSAPRRRFLLAILPGYQLLLRRLASNCLHLLVQSPAALCQTADHALSATSRRLFLVPAAYYGECGFIVGQRAAGGGRAAESWCAHIECSRSAVRAAGCWRLTLLADFSNSTSAEVAGGGQTAVQLIKSQA